MTNYFTIAKEKLKMRDVLETYGIEIKKNNMCLCPFHAEKTPSCKIYENNLHCFGCGEHHDIISFVKKYFDMENMYGALKKLNDDFSLGFNLDNQEKPNNAEVSEFIKRKEQREAYKNWEKDAWKILNLRFKLLKYLKKEYAPHSPDEDLDKRYLFACTNLEQAEYILDEFQNASYDERMNFLEEVNHAKDLLIFWKNKISKENNSKKNLLKTFNREQEKTNNNELLKRRNA